MSIEQVSWIFSFHGGVVAKCQTPIPFFSASLVAAALEFDDVG